MSNFLEYGGSKAFRAYYIILSGFSSGAIFEIIEFISDFKTNKKQQRGLRDTDFDIISDIVGSIGASLVFYLLL